MKAGTIETYTIEMPDGKIYVATTATGQVAVMDKDKMNQSRFVRTLIQDGFPSFEVSDDGHAWRAEAVRDPDLR